MGSLRDHHAEELLRGYDDYDDIHERFERQGRRRPAGKPQRREKSVDQKRRRLRRDEQSRPFKCRRCKAFIGEPLTGGRHRNHCPACLHSLHVDEKTPGDRASTCRSLMEPVSTGTRPNGEQLVIHRCLGCGIVRHNRIAADDDPLLLMRLPLADRQRTERPQVEAESEIA